MYMYSPPPPPPRLIYPWNRTDASPHSKSYFPVRAHKEREGDRGVETIIEKRSLSVEQFRRVFINDTRAGHLAWREFSVRIPRNYADK